jgi:uncharacterized membrane protein
MREQGAALASPPPEAAGHHRLRWKTYLFATVVVLSAVLGNTALAHGMKTLDAASPAQYVTAIFHPWVALGVGLLILLLLTRMTLLSWADLSFVMPITALDYVLTGVSGWLVLNEQLPPARWVGIALIVAGVALVGSTHPSTERTQ